MPQRSIADVDIVEVIAATPWPLHKDSRTKGGEYHGACPWCGGDGRLYVQREAGADGRGLWRCRQCEKSGDALSWKIEQGGLSFLDAAKALQIGLPRIERRGKPAANSLRVYEHREAEVAAIAPPPHDWTWPARTIIEQAKAYLWSQAGAQALAYLRSRSLTDDTIRAAGFGYWPKDEYREYAAFGLPAKINERTGREEQVWIPRSIVIPWELNGVLWRVNFRRAVPPKPKYDKRAHGPKYIPLPSVESAGNVVYGVDTVQPGKPCLLVEGEFNVWAVRQAAGDLTACVGLGSAYHGRRIAWIAKLGLARPLLVGTDLDLDDDAGESAAAYWIDACAPYAYRCAPASKDWNQMLIDTPDLLRDWIVHGIARYQPEVAPLVVEDELFPDSPPHNPATVVAGEYEYDIDGVRWTLYRNGTDEVVATFDSETQLLAALGIGQ